MGEGDLLSDRSRPRLSGEELKKLEENFRDEKILSPGHNFAPPNGSLQQKISPLIS